MAKGKEKSGECPFCKKWGVITDDHIPPKSLFPDPRPNNLITVPACKECNIGSSGDDEIFRTIMALDIRFPQSAAQITENAFRGLKRAKYPILLDARKTAQPVELQSQSGLFLADAYQMSIDSKPIFRVLTKITKGLIYHHTKEYDRRFEIKNEDISMNQDFIDNLDSVIKDRLFHRPDYQRDIGNIFSYRGFSETNKGWIWYIAFNQWHFISIATISDGNWTDAEMEHDSECHPSETS